MKKKEYKFKKIIGVEKKYKHYILRPNYDIKQMRVVTLHSIIEYNPVFADSLNVEQENFMLRYMVNLHRTNNSVIADSLTRAWFEAKNGSMDQIANLYKSMSFESAQVKTARSLSLFLPNIYLRIFQRILRLFYSL